MGDQLPTQPNSVETDIISLDDATGSGTHWVAYAIDPHAIVYFDSYVLALPKELMRYIQRRKVSDFTTRFFFIPLYQHNN